MKLTATFPGGVNVHDAASEALQTARELERPISMVFNDTEVEVRRYDEPSDVIERWREQREADQSARKQARCDKLMANIQGVERMIEEAGDDCLGIRGLRSHAEQLREELALETNS